MLKEHMLSVLQINFDPQVRYHHSIHNYIEEGKEPNLDVNMQIVQGPPTEKFITGIHNFFSISVPVRNEIKLLADANNPAIPLQYRYLSVYKLLEHWFKRNDHWTQDFNKFLDGYESDYKRRKFSNQKLHNYNIVMY